MAIHVIPRNKYIIIEPLKEDEKIGSIYVPGNALEKQHRLAKVVAKDDCAESASIDVGDLVFYDHIGAVTGRVGNKVFTAVKAINVVCIIKEQQ